MSSTGSQAAQIGHSRARLGGVRVESKRIRPRFPSRWNLLDVTLPALPQERGEAPGRLRADAILHEARPTKQPSCWP